MKKILTLTIATLSLVTLAACAGQKSDSDMKKTDDSSMMKKDDMKKDDMKDSSMSDDKMKKEDMKDSSMMSDSSSEMKDVLLLVLLQLEMLQRLFWQTMTLPICQKLLPKVGALLTTFSDLLRSYL